jgi:hypothetical protein
MCKVNLGYAFVNFTMNYVVLQLYYLLQGCGWKLYDSNKHNNIVLSNI